MRIADCGLRIVAIVCLGLPLLAAAPASRPTPKDTVIAVFDFASNKADDPEKIGERVGEAIRMKLEREPGTVMVDGQSLRDAVADRGLAVNAATKAEVIAALGKDIGADILAWGAVERKGDEFILRARVLDLTRRKPDLYVERDFPASGYREIPFAVQRIVNALRRDTDALDPALDPRDPGPQPVDPKVLARPNLIPNGDLSAGDTTPARWTPVDGLVSFYLPAGDRPGKCLMFDTDVSEAQWLEWNKKFTLGTKEAPPAPIRGKGEKYETVGGNHGAWLYSEYIPVQKGVTYRISFDAKGSGGKVFIKGYAQYPDQRREVYRAYKNLYPKTGGREWEHYTRTFNPTAMAPDVQWLRVEPYVYWPPGKYYFANFHLSEEPR